MHNYRVYTLIKAKLQTIFFHMLSPCISKHLCHDRPVGQPCGLRHHQDVFFHWITSVPILKEMGRNKAYKQAKLVYCLNLKVFFQSISTWPEGSDDMTAIWSSYKLVFDHIFHKNSHILFEGSSLLPLRHLSKACLTCIITLWKTFIPVFKKIFSTHLS